MAKKAPAKSVDLDPSMRIVVLHGEERFLVEEHTRRFAAALDEKYGGVEQFAFDGETVDPASVLDELRSYGLMQRHKLVILDHADAFLAGGGKGATEDENDEAGDADDSGKKASRRPLMERYAEKPVPDATLVLRAKTWRKGKLDKLIEKVGAIKECAALSEAKATTWCRQRCEKRYGTTIEPAAAELLVSRIGPHLLHLDTELMKLAAMVGEGQAITRDHVADAVGLSREEKAWEIQSAILTGDAAAMLTKLRELLDISLVDEVPITWAICDLMRKMHTACQLSSRGVPPQGVFSQAKLWGSTGNRIMEITGEHEPAVFAQLLRDAIEVDQFTKSGVGDPQRNLEGLLVTIADRLSPTAAAR